VRRPARGSARGRALTFERALQRHSAADSGRADGRHNLRCARALLARPLRLGTDRRRVQPRTLTPRRPCGSFKRSWCLPCCRAPTRPCRPRLTPRAHTKAPALKKHRVSVADFKARPCCAARRAARELSWTLAGCELRAHAVEAATEAVTVASCAREDMIPPCSLHFDERLGCSRSCQPDAEVRLNRRRGKARDTPMWFFRSGSRKDSSLGPQPAQRFGGSHGTQCRFARRRLRYRL
jgi:hypothetical protein